MLLLLLREFGYSFRAIPFLFSLHDLQYLTSFEGGAGHEGDGLADVAALHADHVGVLVVAIIWDLLRLVHPRVPHNRVGKVVSGTKAK